MSQFALLLTALLLGALLGRRGWMPGTTPAVLNAWVLRIALPALILVQVPQIRFEPALLFAVLGPWLVLAGAWLLLPMIGRARGWSRGQIGALILTCGLGNTAFMGLPMIQALFGAQAMGVAVIADQLGTFLALSTGGVIVAAAYSGSAVTASRIAHRVLTFPPFVALLVAILVGVLGGWPVWAGEVLTQLGATLTPTALFAVGFQLRLGDLRAYAGPLAAGLGWKLLLAPLLVLAVAGLLATPGPVAQVTVAQCAMAPMITAGILAADSDLEPPLATAAVGLGIALSFVSVPLWVWAMG